MWRALFVSAVLLTSALAWANWPIQTLPDSAVADRVVVHKAAHTLELYAHGMLLKSYRVSIGHTPVGAKHVQGDGRTPEGQYTLDSRNPHSSFHLALHVSYPSVADSARSRAAGVDPGGLIMVHGLPDRIGWVGRFQRLVDWTDGCVAVTNREIEEIWRVVPTGTPIQLTP